MFRAALLVPLPFLAAFAVVCVVQAVLMSRSDNLFEINQYLLRNIKYRLAFREFGTCLGAQCQAEHITEKERGVDLKTWSDSIIAAWDPYMELSISEGLTPEDLRPITRVMYASALIPGGKCHQPWGSFSPDKLSRANCMPSFLFRLFGT